MAVVRGFWSNAEQVFEVAAAASDSCDLAILIQPDGAVRLMDASGWQLPALAAHSGADAVYRVTRQNGRVRVEGRSRTHSCLLQSETPWLRSPVPQNHFLAALPAPATPCKS